MNDYGERQADLTPRLAARTPDVLDCLANLSSDEVFTPPALANQMLDILPKEVWKNPDLKFLDPFCKSGVFLREIAKRLFVGLAEKIPDPVARREHILRNQVFGVAITDMTAKLARRSLYYSKDADCPYSVVRFASPDGNILFLRCEHRWEDGQCTACGASQKTWKRGKDAETYAYPFIHSEELMAKLDELKFDIVIGNPPYQMDDGGGIGGSAMPIYQLFVTQGIKLNPWLLSMIIPSRWFVGGKGLDEFRDRMLHDSHLKELHDYPDAGDCFPGVAIKGGVCYFVRDKLHNGPCTVLTYHGGKAISKLTRPLLEEGTDVFIRFNESISIYKKVCADAGVSFSSLVSVRRPFGLDSTFNSFSKNGEISVYANKSIRCLPKSYDFPQNKEWVNKYKVFITFAYGAGESYPHQILNKPIFGDKMTACTETYLVIGPFATKEITENVISYIKTKFFRFMVMLRKYTQNGTKQVYEFVPMQDFSKPWTDEELYKKYKLTEEEIAFIESMIRPMEGGENV